MKPYWVGHRGFTLIEILTAVAVILLLIAILLPVFHQVRGQANAKRCMSNLSQLGKAFLLYLQDWDERFPVSVTVSQRPAPTWVVEDVQNRRYLPEQGAIYPYVRNSEVYLCPSDPSAHESRLSYMMNAELGDLGGDVIRYYSELEEPATLVLLAEFEKNGFFDSAFGFCPGDFPVGAPYVCPDMVPYCVGDRCLQDLACRHVGRVSNVVFCDGHAKGFPPGALLCKHTRVE